MKINNNIKVNIVFKNVEFCVYFNYRKINNNF